MRNSKGITLIALVITIIVLIILAAVSLNVLLGENGIIGRAQQASKETKLSAFKEKLEMEIAAIVTDLLVEGKEANLDNVGDKLGELGYYVGPNPEGDGSAIVETLDGGKATVYPDLTVEVEGAPAQSGGGTIIPADTTPPTGIASYSTTAPTNGSVIVTIDIDEPVITPIGGWTMEGTDQKKYTREYTMNVTEGIVEITDLAGNMGYVTINISNIDNTNPTGMASYNPNTLTGGTVTVTITTNKEINTPDGWTMVGTDKKVFTKSYDSNWTGAVPITDLASNTGSVSVAVTNILTGASVENPTVTGGLTPIKYNGTSWVNTTTSDSEWYDYIAQTTGTASGGTSKWANAITSNGSMLVWIPRYEYKITSGEHTATAGVIDVNFISKTTLTPTAGYTIHPAFTNAGNNGLGELEGIWVGKFESSSENGSTGTSGNNVKIVPNAVPWTSINVSTMFSKAQAFGTNNGLTGYDSHMMKNTEWGAVAYLAHSKYGRNGTEVTINNHMNSSTADFKTGYAGYTVSASYNNTERAVTDTTSTTGTFPYNNTYRGVLASTTGNVYGVYDMSGGTYEYVMGVYNKTTGSSGFASSLTGIDAKYYDNYTGYAATYKGDAVYETSSSSSSSNGSWFGDYSYFVTSSIPWFLRGGYASAASNAGLFCFIYNNGTAYTDFSFRVVVTK